MYQTRVCVLDSTLFLTFFRHKCCYTWGSEMMYSANKTANDQLSTLHRSIRRIRCWMLEPEGPSSYASQSTPPKRSLSRKGKHAQPAYTVLRSSSSSLLLPPQKRAMSPPPYPESDSDTESQTSERDAIQLLETLASADPIASLSEITTNLRSAISTLDTLDLSQVEQVCMIHSRPIGCGPHDQFTPRTKRHRNTCIKQTTISMTAWPM